MINGTKDVYVSRAQNEAMFRPFASVAWHWDKGLGHDFPEHWYAIACAWIKEALAREDA